MYEAFLSSLEKKGPDALEMAAKAHEKGKEKAKTKGAMKIRIRFSLFEIHNAKIV